MTTTVMGVAQDFLENVVLPTIGEDIVSIFGDPNHDGWIRVNTNHWVKNNEHGNWNLSYVRSQYETSISGVEVCVTLITQDNIMFGVVFDYFNKSIIKVLLPTKSKEGNLVHTWVILEEMQDSAGRFHDSGLFAFTYSGNKK